jgi:glycosyltransferase involved in cell wall biosynthesis
LNSYTDSRIKVITNDINIGAGLSRRKGTKEANGEYTIFLDGDDWLDDDYVETLYKYAKKYNADVVSNGI